MIKYNLKCENDHEFESWFSDSKEFENLKNKRMLECIYCDSKKIIKSIMAPMISLDNEKNEISENNKALRDEKIKLLQIRKYVEKTLNMLERILVKELEKFIMIKKIKKLSMALQQRKKEKISQKKVLIYSPYPG